MSVSDPSPGAPPPMWVLAAIAVCAFLCVLAGAVVVEPALHRLASGPDLARAFPPAREAPGRVEVGDPLLAGRYGAEGLVLDVDGGAIERSGGGRLETAPHRLAEASQPASAARSFASAMAVPSGAQIEIRRVVADRGSRLCDGHLVGWLALAIHTDGVVLMPVRQGPPPGALTPDDRLCPVSALKRGGSAWSSPRSLAWSAPC